MRFGSPPGGGRAPSLQPQPEGGGSHRGLQHPRCPRGWSGSRRWLQHAGVAVGRSAPTPRGRRSPHRLEHPHPEPLPSHQRCCQRSEAGGTGTRSTPGFGAAGKREHRELELPGLRALLPLQSHQPAPNPRVAARPPPALHVPQGLAAGCGCCAGGAVAQCSPRPRPFAATRGDGPGKQPPLSPSCTTCTADSPACGPTSRSLLHSSLRGSGAGWCQTRTVPRTGIWGFPPHAVGAELLGIPQSRSMLPLPHHKHPLAEAR